MKSMVAVLLIALTVTPSWAADTPRDNANTATKSARIEMLRARLGATSSTTASATLIEAESLLRQLRAAPADKESSLSAQLDAALARLELEIANAGRDRP